MPRVKELPLTHEEVFNEYFGGMKAVQFAPLPFKCVKCTDGVWHVEQMSEHAREKHKQRVVSQKTRDRLEAKRVSQQI